MKNNLKKIIISLIFIFGLFTSQKVLASSLILKPSTDILGIDEQFYVDVLLDTENKTINGVEGTIIFPTENFSFVRAEEGQSVISLWVEKAKVYGNKINLSGIIPNGFSGVIDPFNQDKKLPGLVIRLVFEAKVPGEPVISSSDFYATLNDGQGTVDNIVQSSLKLTIQNFHKPIVRQIDNDVTPELTAYVTQDPNLFSNRYVLIFDAKDNQTGIKEVLVKEGYRSWKKAQSPYLLEDQTRHSIITIQAINYSDSGIIMTIDALPYKMLSFRNISIVIVLLFVLFLIVKKIYEKFKNIHN